MANNDEAFASTTVNTATVKALCMQVNRHVSLLVSSPMDTDCLHGYAESVSSAILRICKELETSLVDIVESKHCFNQVKYKKSPYSGMTRNIRTESTLESVRGMNENTAAIVFQTMIIQWKSSEVKPGPSPGWVRDFTDRSVAFVKERNWTKFDTIKNLELAICGEAGELCGAIAFVDETKDLSAQECAAVLTEAADVFIYLCRLARHYGCSDKWYNYFAYATES